MGTLTENYFSFKMELNATHIILRLRCGTVRDSNKIHAAN